MLVRASLALAAACVANAALAVDWSDTSIGYRFGTRFREPFNPENVTKNIVNLTHADGYKYGSNYLNVDLLNSGGTDSDAQEAYVVYRHTLDLGKVMGREFKYGFVRGLGVTAGFDWNTKNDPGYGSRKRMLVLGPTLMLDVPGFLDAGVYLLHESNQPAAANIDRYTYDLHPMLGLAWGIPLGGSGFSFQGYLNYIAAKGKDEFGNGTAPEFNFDGALMYDASPWLHASKNSVKVGFEYQYWRNKFGNPHTVTGSLAKTPMVRAEYHF